MMAHTPGPWIAEDYDEATIAVRAVSESEYIAYLDENSADDARLIAAAPDLLEALQKIALGEGRYSRDQLTHCSNTVEDMKTIANAAIAKATGES